MLFRITFRHPTARLALTASFAVLCALGCANRGMEAPHDGGAGTTATGGAGGGAGGKAGSGGKGGTGGSGASGGRGGVGGTIKDAGCSLLTDALVDHSTTTCNALFNFETGTEGATIPASTQGAFTGVDRKSVV